MPGKEEVPMEVFKNGEGVDRETAIFTANERQTRVTVSGVMPMKNGGEFAVGRARAFSWEFEVDKGGVAPKSNWEPPMTALPGEVSRHRAVEGDGRTVAERKQRQEGGSEIEKSEMESSKFGEQAAWRRKSVVDDSAKILVRGDPQPGEQC